MRTLRAIAKTYDDDEYIEQFELVSDKAADLDVSKEDISIVRHGMKGPAARFDPELGKNVVDMLTGSERYPVEVCGIERRDNRLTIYCGKISTRVEFDLTSPAWQLGRSDISETVNSETARFTRHTYEGNSVSFAYRQFTPELKSGERYPVVFALPGSGETGDKCGFDNNLQIADSRLSLAFATDVWQKDHPCYIVSPQFPSLEESYETSAYERAWVDMINELVEHGQADPERIYGATLSMGSRIIYSMLEHYPEFFAGLIINCGNPDNHSFEDLGDIPVLLTHIENDCAVMTDFGKQAFSSFIGAGNRQVRIRLYPTSIVDQLGLSNSHMSWSPAMADRGNLEWLFSQRKDGPKPAKEVVPQIESGHGHTAGVLFGDEVFVLLGKLADTEGWSLREDAQSLVVTGNGREVVINPSEKSIVSAPVPEDDKLSHAIVREYQGDCYVRYDFLSVYMDESVLVHFA